MQRHSRAFWVEAVAEVDNGSDPMEVARQCSVRVGTLLWWRSRLRSERRRQEPDQRAAELLPVVLAGASLGGQTAVEVEVGPFVIRARARTDVELVAAIARALARPC